MSLTVYHGGTDIVQHPDCKRGRGKLDFGRGFYLTLMKDQAERWARQLEMRRNEPPVVNVYRLDKEKILKEYRCKILPAYDNEWLQFIIKCRTGYDSFIDYDYIEGGIADDRVIDSINLYLQGYLSVAETLGRLARYIPNNQICLLNQELTDKYLIYVRTEEL